MNTSPMNRANPEDESRAGIDLALAESARELAALFERHKALLTGVLDARAPVAQNACLVPACPCRRALRKTLAETIAILDETRKSFKSRQLAMLRHRLIEILGEHD